MTSLLFKFLRWAVVTAVKSEIETRIAKPYESAKRIGESLRKAPATKDRPNLRLVSSKTQVATSAIRRKG